MVGDIYDAVASRSIINSVFISFSIFVCEQAFIRRFYIMIQIRRFVKSFKRFPAPLKRLEAVACDAELQEKPLAELRRLGELLRERCTSSMTELQAQKENESTHNEDSNLSVPAQKRRGRGPSFKLGGVSVNAKSLMAAEKELEVLDEALPSDPAERQKWILDARYRFSSG
jgi:chromodomain-helicase-DNA-binding protein 1